MREIWKDIKGYEGLYQVSNLGNVKSLTRQIKCLNSKYRTINGKVLKALQMNNNYLFVNLWKNNVIKRALIHRLVAEAFIPNPNNELEVNHIDGNKHNNCVNNLEWCNRSYNTLHSYKIGLREKQKDKIRQNNILNKSKPVLQYDLQGNFIKEWKSVSAIVKYYNYSQGLISNCCRHERNKAYGYKWEYKISSNTISDKRG